MGVLLVFILVAEVGLLLWAEKKIWHTLYTPFSFLAVPYLFVVLFTILVSGRFGLVSFYFPSLLPWIAGLPLFFIPSLLCHFLKLSPAGRMPGDPAVNTAPGFQTNDVWKLIVTGGIFLWMVVRLVRMGIMYPDPIGSERFGAAFASKGWAGHLMVIGMSLLLIWTYKLKKVRLNDKKDLRFLWIWLAFGGLLFLLFIYQVKSWIVLPVIGGLLAKMLYRKMKFKPLYFFLFLLGGGSVFFLSYLLMYICGSGMFPDAVTWGDQLKSISGLFLHYVTSGTLGLSMDMQNGIVETAGIQYVLTPFYNVWYLLTGQPLIEHYSLDFLYTGLNYTNVRTLFGTLYVFLDSWEFVFCILGGSAVCYFLFLLYRRYNGFYTRILYAWSCVILFMGWFESYVQLLVVFEIPFWLLAFYFADRLFSQRKHNFVTDKKA